LHHRCLYTSSSTLFTEALELSDLPAGHIALCQAAMHGRLADPQQNFILVEDYWQGLEAWAAARQISISSSLANLLSSPLPGQL
jgi:hypothetical protein